MTSTILEAVLNEHEDETLDHHGVKGMRNVEATVSKRGDRRVMSVMNSAGAIASGLAIDSAFNGGYRAKKTRHITGNADRIREKVDFDSWTKELKK